MSLNVAVQMDPIEKINVKGDSSFAMMLEAQRRGHTLFYYQTKTLALASGILSATGHEIRVRDEASNFYSLGEEERVSLSDYDVVLMRQDPPFDMGYITATHMLDHIHPQTLVVNDPTEVRNAPEKLFVLNYREFMPPTLITRDASELAAFRMQHEDIIIKPLYGNGGIGVFRIRGSDQNFASLLEIFGHTFRDRIDRGGAVDLDHLGPGSAGESERRKGRDQRGGLEAVAHRISFVSLHIHSARL